MIANFTQILDAVKKKNFAPVYVLDGEEVYFLEKLITVFENEILSPAEKEFNFTVLYGRDRDTDWKEVVNACRRFPMFAERQIVILKEAASLPDFGELLPYFLQPSPTTILVVEYRNKKIDGKTKIAKALKEKDIVYFHSEKLKETAIPAWLKAFGKEVGFSIADKEADMLTMYLGNDLQKLTKEIEKIRINVPEEKALSAALIQKHIGINRDYNLFDFTNAFFGGNKEKSYRMMSYFIENVRTNPLIVFTGGFYFVLNQLYRANHARNLSQNEMATAIGCSPYKVSELMNTTKRWNLHKIEEAILLISQTNAMAVGIRSTGTEAELLKEFFGKMELIEMMN